MLGGELSNATVRAQKMAELAGEAYVPDLITKGSGKISWNPRAMIWPPKHAWACMHTCTVGSGEKKGLSALYG